MKCLKMIEAKGTGHKEDSVILLTFDGEKVVYTRGDLKAAILNKDLCVSNMEVTKNNRLVKTSERIAWLNADMLSYDVNNGICEMHLQSDNIDQINEFMFGVEKIILSDSENDASISYTYNKDNKNGKYDVIVRWIHVDGVVNSLAKLPHKFDMTALLSEREKGNQNFVYMTNEQFGSLTHYLNTHLNCI